MRSVPSVLRTPAAAYVRRLERKMWTAVVTQADADSLLGLFGSFHDGCIREAHVWGGYYVSPDMSMKCPSTPDLQCSLLIQRQWEDPSVIELLFDQVSRITVAAPEAFDRIISAADLRVEPDRIVWSSVTEFEEVNREIESVTSVVGRRAWWRAIDNGLGSVLRYGVPDDLPNGFAL